jgi:hypothetical protein
MKRIVKPLKKRTEQAETLATIEVEIHALEDENKAFRKKSADNIIKIWEVPRTAVTSDFEALHAGNLGETFLRNSGRQP